MVHVSPVPAASSWALQSMGTWEPTSLETIEGGSSVPKHPAGAQRSATSGGDSCHMWVGPTLRAPP